MDTRFPHRSPAESCVVINGQSSSELSVASGVPQGFVLVPTLFLAYINDLPMSVTCHINLFADDTLIY